MYLYVILYKHIYIYITAAAQPPAAIINHHFSGQPIVTRYVSGLINGRNKNRIKLLLVRSIISSIPGYISALFVYSFMMRACVCVCVCIAGNCFYFAGALAAPQRVSTLLLYSIKLGFGAFIGIRARISASAQLDHIPSFGCRRR